ncbi:MAG TPA: methyltransferase domain-containing protein [Opitutaceae bacterium]|jgi:tRNA (cmo5U34)-methyltransferase|nr:methyltransferase domain-containing protein [Opitutaceae bacterium]
MNQPKLTVEQIRARFDGEVERFSNLETGQVATVDAACCLDLVAATAAAATPGARDVLDVGCGAGNYSLKLRERLPGARFTLVDLSRPMLERARQRLGGSVAAEHQEDVRRLDFAPGSFDVIVAAAVLHHLRTPEEWARVFAGFRRWLRPGGGLWIFDLVSHEHPAVQAEAWARYDRYLTDLGGPAYRARVFDYIEREDTPAPLAWQLELLRRSGFAAVDVLHKNSCFAAFGGVAG